jgi:LmbE family N-acetylglucosaminyl deacetylase
MFSGNDTVLIIGAHPDDEVLGVGGSIAKHTAVGDEVHILILTEGSTQQYDDNTIVEQKRKEAKRCAEHLGVKKVHFGDLPDMRLDSLPHVEVNAVIERICEKINPDVVYTHSKREINQDHVEAHKSTLVATRPNSGVSTVLAYETPSSTDFSTTVDGFNPDLYIDIEEYLDTKVEAFERYETELREFPHPRSGEALRAIAKARGAASGAVAAEAFDILRAYR